MQIKPVTQQKPSFGIKFNLSEKSITQIEKSTGLTRKELTTLTFDEQCDLMKQRGTLKKPNKLKQWCANKYREIGEKLGLLEKQHNIYTDPS